MSKLAAIFACTTAVALITVTQLWRQLHVERTSNQQLRVSATRKVIEPPRAWGGGQASQPTKIATPATTAVGTDTPLMKPPSGGTVATNAATTGIDLRQLLKDPKYREAQHAQTRLRMPQIYPDVAREVGLTAVEAEEFFDLLAKQQYDRMALTVAAGEGEQSDRMEAQRKLRMAQREDQADLARFLGPNREQAWQDYQQSLGARRQVNQLGTLLTAAGHPLTDSQARPLIASIATEQQRLKEEGRSRPTSQEPNEQAQYNEAILKASEESNSRIIESARPYLNTQQLSALKTLMAQRNSLAGVAMIQPANR